MNRLFITTASAILLGALTLLSSCSISSDASHRTVGGSDDVEITEGPDGVMIIKVKQTPVNPYNNNQSTSTGTDSYSTVTRSYNLVTGWKSISVSSNIFVEYTPSQSYGPIKVNCEEWLHRYVDVRVSGKELIVRLSNSIALEGKSIRTPITVYLSAPPVNSIMTSSVATVKVLGDLKVDGMFSALSSGASSISLQNVNTLGDISILTSGASSITANNLQCFQTKVALSGSSELTVHQDINCQSVTLEPSGASSLSINGKCIATGASVQVSGASTLNLKHFDGTWMDVEVSGPAEGNIGMVSANKLYVQSGGVSKVQVDSFNGTTLATDVQGISTMKVNKISATRVLTEVSSQSEATLSGNAEEVHFSTNNGTIDASRLKVNKAHVSINGDGAKVAVKANKIYTDD